MKKDLIYDQLYHRLAIYNTIFAEIGFDNIPNPEEMYDYERMDKFKVVFEIDQFAKEYSDTHKKYLENFFDEYLNLQNRITKYIIHNKEIEHTTFHHKLIGDVDFIVEHLKGILNKEHKIKEQPHSIKISKNEKHYNRITESFSQLSKIYEKMYFDRSNGVPLCEYPETKDIDQFKICTEIDQFKIKYPETYEKYLRQLLIEYTTLMFSKDDYISKYLPDYNKEFIDQYGFYNLFSAIDYIVEHLKEIFKIDDVRDILKDGNGVKPAEKQHKIRTPKGKSILTREQNALLFFYLREKRLIAEPTNQNMAIAIKILSGYSESQMQEILKAPETPSHQLGKGNDKVSRNDYKSVITELENLLERIKKDYNAYSYNNELR